MFDAGTTWNPEDRPCRRCGQAVEDHNELGYVVPMAGIPDAQLKSGGGGEAKIQRLEAKYQAHFGIGFEEAGRALKRSMGRDPRRERLDAS
jgi:hypothetical protein